MAPIGLFTAGLGLLGATLIVMIFQNTASSILVGFGFGGSLLALFLRVGGGIFTKAADVGADLVGKVEAGIPEDDARNPATIADNVGDNVGDCAGMASDLFESFGVVLVANIILGVTAFRRHRHRGRERGQGPDLPARHDGASASWPPCWPIFLVQGPRRRDRRPQAHQPGPERRLDHLASSAPRVVAFVYVGDPAGSEVSNVGLRMFVAIVTGVVLGQAASRITQYFTSSQFKPVRDIAESGRTGPATVVLSGISSRHGVRGVGGRRHRRGHHGGPRASAAAARCSPSTWSP